ncbi:sterol carrier protein 2-like [Battus philenor]|uniref:sterol carrier protein 2-like n=1 Tax=Battus philenor TaxID=42288 RepID=UPI0035CFD638
MSTKVYVVGVGMTDFVKPNSSRDYPEIAKEAVDKALADSGIRYDAVQQAVCGYVYGDSACGQRVLYQVGMTGIPIHNVNNHGATGGTALYLAHQLVQGGSDVVLSLGFDKMSTGPLPSAAFINRTYPMDVHIKKLRKFVKNDKAPPAIQCFGHAAVEHMEKYGTKEIHFSKIAVKNHKNASKNPHALNKNEYSLDEILNSKRMFGPITKLQCCANCDGAAAAILMSARAVEYYKLQSKAVEIAGMAMATDTSPVFTDTTRLRIAGCDMTALAAKQVYQKTGITPNQVDVVELHDCFASNELITYEYLQLCEEGKGGQFVDAGDNTYGGKVVVNPSGGLIGKGNPIGATGMAQCVELVWQLRGDAGQRQVNNARIGLQHNLGLGGAVIVAIYRKSFEGYQQNFEVNVQNFKVYKYIKIIEEAIKNYKGNIPKDIRGVYAIKVKKGPSGFDGNWIVDVKEEGKGNVTYNGNQNPDVTITVNDEDALDLLQGKLEPLRAIFQGKIKLQGKVELIMKLQKYISTKSQSIRAKI